MATEKIWTRDWFGAVAFTVVFLIVAYGIFGDGFQSLERYGYDLGVRAHQRTPSDRIAVIAIDDQSVQNLGRWPWPRTLHAQMLDKLREGGAKVVANTVFYSEAQQDPGLRYINEISDLLQKSPLARQVPVEIQTFGEMLNDLGRQNAAAAGIAGAYRGSALNTQYQPALDALQAKLKEARAQLSADNVLGQSMGQFGHVLLPMTFEIGRPQGRPDQPLPDYIRKFQLTNIQDRVDARGSGALPLPTTSVQFPVPELGSVASGIGHLNATPDVDGAVRYEPLVLQYFDEFYPSLSLMVAAQALNLTPKDIEVRLGEGIAMGGVTIRTTPSLRMYTQFYADHDGQPAFPVDSFFDVITGKIPASKYKGKIVIIGATARGVGVSFPTPVSAAMAPAQYMAHSVSSILQQDFFTRPNWAGYAEFALILVLAAYLALALPRLGAGLAAGITGGLVVALLVAQFVLLSGPAVWFKFTVPAVFVALGHGFMLLKRFRITEKLKESSEAESSESNKMLGLAFQGQGQLDMAFEKFSRVQPVDDRLLDLLYNLALDFERKRQFNKAESVYQHIAKHNKEFRDVQQKLSRAKKLSETVILGGTSSGGRNAGPGGTLVLDATQQMEKPMLGRYQVEKELGKGAMGIVYLGRDPKIGRTVAIKTMALSQEFEPDELNDVKSRFFREAETAGRLSHPNIVQIFDAGEEHDLAYIAMEFIRGHDLTKHIKANALLPVNEVLKYVADAADALDYAHSNGVIHRDIKPANMMLLDTKSIKLMDFGIARLADSSKTKTGMVLGTPSYMSPEQLSGKKVDGRSDLFSLGVTLYQLLTGNLPFQADSMATLMFKIANEPHASIVVIRPDLPAALGPIVDRALQKDADQRYQRGADLARDLRAVLGG
ncbi:MAG: CHASE2 domain-containing protein [Nevskiaceae bacterium]|nr:MAG: CHASE2 domain-containing protein [Nevskiaceae bacterium]